MAPLSGEPRNLKGSQNRTEPMDHWFETMQVVPQLVYILRGADKECE